MLHELTGRSIILLYSNVIFKELYNRSGKTFPITPRQGTYLVGAVNTVGSIMAT